MKTKKTPVRVRITPKLSKPLSPNNVQAEEDAAKLKEFSDSTENSGTEKDTSARSSLTRSHE